MVEELTSIAGDKAVQVTPSNEPSNWSVAADGLPVVSTWTVWVFAGAKLDVGPIRVWIASVVPVPDRAVNVC